MPLELAVSDWAVATTSTLSAARSASGSRPSRADAGSSGRPLSSARSTSAAQSTNVEAPGSAQLKVIVETARKVSPSSSPVRSTSMS